MDRKIIGIGETVLDIIFKDDQPQRAVPGGSTFNAVVSLGRAGADCAIVTEVGDDHIGDITCKYLEDNGVNTQYVTHRQGVRSHLSLAFLDEQNDAQYLFYKDHANVALNCCLPSITENDAVLFGSFFAINPVIRTQVKQLLQRAYDAGATLYYDINFRASHIKDIPDTLSNIRENMQMSTVVRGSLEDFSYLYNETDVDTIYEKHIRPYCKLFICTNSNKPIELRTPDIKASYATHSIATVSTIGAGDNFNAGFLYAYTVLSNNASDSQAKPLCEYTESEWTELIATGQRFSANVCQQYENSITQELAMEMKSKHK